MGLRVYLVGTFVGEFVGAGVPLDQALVARYPSYGNWGYAVQLIQQVYTMRNVAVLWVGVKKRVHNPHVIGNVGGPGGQVT